MLGYHKEGYLNYGPLKINYDNLGFLMLGYHQLSLKNIGPLGFLQTRGLSCSAARQDVPLWDASRNEVGLGTWNWSWLAHNSEL